MAKEVFNGLNRDFARMKEIAQTEADLGNLDKVFDLLSFMIEQETDTNIIFDTLEQTEQALIKRFNQEIANKMRMGERIYRKRRISAVDKYPTRTNAIQVFRYGQNAHPQYRYIGDSISTSEEFVEGVSGTLLHICSPSEENGFTKTFTFEINHRDEEGRMVYDQIAVASQPDGTSVQIRQNLDTESIMADMQYQGVNKTF